MTFILSSGSTSYTLPLDPQQWELSPQPKKSIEKTLGGQIVQLLGYTVTGSFTALLHNPVGSTLESKAQDVPDRLTWNDAILFKQFMVVALANQKEGIPSHISWREQNFDEDVALGDFGLTESLETIGYVLSVPFTVVNVTSPYQSGASMNATIANLLQEIGDMSANIYHGGSGDLSGIKQITGFNDQGPTVKDSSESSSSVPSAASSGEIQNWTHNYMLQNGYSEADWNAAAYIIQHESGWNPQATNPSSGAYGLPQSLPGNKMASAGADWKTNYQTQVKWFLNYCNQRYGGVQNAYNFWVKNHWY